MRRIGLWSVGVAAVLAGCSGDGAASSGATATVALGRLPGTLTPASTTTATTTTTTTTTSEPEMSTVLAEALAGMFADAPAPAPPMDIVADDTGRLNLEVPTEWDDRRTAPSIAASTDLVTFLDGYDAPGLTAVVVDEPPAEALRDYQFDEDCERLKQGHYRTDRLDGEYRSWRACGGTGTGIVVVAADTGSETVVVLAQVLGASDLAAVDAALHSVEIDG